MRPTLKALSLDEQVTAARRAVYAALETSRSGYYETYGDMPEAYPIQVYDDAVIVQEGLVYFRVPYTIADGVVSVPPRADWELVDQAWVAANGSPAAATKRVDGGAVKAAGEYELDVLAAPYGGPVNGRDSHGEYFSSATKFHEDKWPLPPAVYYHGFDPSSNAPAGEPAYIGAAISRTVKADGVWYRVTLDRASAAAKRVWEAAKRGAAIVSSGSIAHLTRTERDGHITHWPIAEISIWESDTGRKQANAYAIAIPAVKALYGRLDLSLPADIDPPQAPLTGSDQQRSDASAAPIHPTGAPIPAPIKRNDMTPEEIQKIVEAALKRQSDELAAAAELKRAEEERTAAAVKAAVDAVKAEWAVQNRLPGSDVSVPTPLKFGETRKYDGLDAADMAVVIGVLEGQSKVKGQHIASEAAYKALAIKLDESQTQTGEATRQAFKSFGIKANEVQYSTLASFGDEWVSVSYSNAIWDQIRQGTFVVGKLPSVEVPQGAESIVLPLDGADPTFYKVAQTTGTNATTLRPDATVPTSQMGTANKTLSVGKMGARVIWSGELDEDSIVPFASQLRMQLATAGSEQLEHLVIDGDAATGATTNINHIGGTPGGTELFLLFNGFRLSCLVTTTANSRSAGVLDSSDYLETIKLMGAAGINALDISKVEFIIDPNTHWASLQLADVKTRDVNAAATIENGKLTSIYGYRVNVSPFMHFKSATRKANTSGKVDQTTTANNTTGSILAVRWDQWKLGWKRRMTMETTRVPSSDSTEIVALMRVGMVQRDTEASAISYGVVV